MTFFCYVADKNGYWLITIKRILVGPHATFNLRPVVEIYVDDKFVNNYKTDTFLSNDVFPINKSFEIGPVKKKEPKVTIKVYSDRVGNSKHIKVYTIDGKIYDLQKNGYTPKDPQHFVDVAFSWRDKPK